MMLCEEGNSSSRTDILLSFEQLQFTGKNLDQSGLASAVGAQNSNTTVHIHAKIDVFIKDFFLGVAKTTVFDLQNGWRDFLGLGELETNRNIVLDFLNDFHFFKFLHTALGHRGSGVVGSEFRNDGLVLFDFVLLFFVLLHLLLLLLL